MRKLEHVAGGKITLLVEFFSALLIPKLEYMHSDYN
jgi:hypothetical protein